MDDDWLTPGRQVTYKRCTGEPVEAVVVGPSKLGDKYATVQYKRQGIEVEHPAALIRNIQQHTRSPTTQRDPPLPQSPSSPCSPQASPRRRPPDPASLPMTALTQCLSTTLTLLLAVALGWTKFWDGLIVNRFQLDRPLLWLLQYVPLWIMHPVSIGFHKLLVFLVRLVPFLGNPNHSPEMKAFVLLFKTGDGIHLNLHRARFVLGATHFMYPPIKGIECEYLPHVGYNGSYLLHSTKEPNPGVILWCFGGACIGGNAPSWQGLMGGMGQQCGCNVMLPDYRLSPEYPLSIIVKDVLEAYKHLLKLYEPDRIILGGVSSGAMLSFLLLSEIRELSLPMPAGIGALSAWLDLTQSTPSLLHPTKDTFITQKVVDFVVSFGYGLCPENNPKEMSPLFRSCEKFPPMLLVYSDTECCADENALYAEAARECGVDVTTYVMEDQFHAWALFQMCPEGRRAYNRMVDWITHRLAGATSDSQSNAD